MTNLLVGMLAETFVHPGVGQNEGAIDLPVAREAITGYPYIPGSSMKGAWRTAFEDAGNTSVNAIFGKEDEGAGRVLVSDARLLLLPVRSLSAAYYWVTCPLLLERYLRDRMRLGLEGKSLTRILDGLPALEDGEAMVAGGVPAGRRIFLEERLFDTRDGLPGTAGDEDPFHVFKVLFANDLAAKRLDSMLCLVSDEAFGWFARNALPVQARNRLKETTKASDSLWYEESLAPDTLMYAGFTPRGARGDAYAAFCEEAKKTPYLQAGGNETVGQGWFALSWLSSSPDGGAS